MLTLILAYDVSGIGGNIYFYTKWIECGQKPVEIKGPGFWGGGAAHYVKTPVIALIRYQYTYFCTPLEAEIAGFSADPDEYKFIFRSEANEAEILAALENDNIMSNEFRLEKQMRNSAENILIIGGVISVALYYISRKLK